jgi:RNA polymerase sigma factor for flagellar operon FliA
MHAPINEPRQLTPAQQEMVLQYGPLVRKVARTLPLQIPAIFDFDDAVSFGTCGLIEAVKRYDADRHDSFPAYAAQRIRGAIIDAFRRLDWQTRSMRQRTRELQRTHLDLEARLSRTPTDDEIADALGTGVDQVRASRSLSRWVTVSLNRLLDSQGDGDAYLGAERVQVEENDDITASLDEQELRRDLVRAIQQLPERERQIINLYYGDALTMREVAEIIGVSETRVSQIHARAIERMRNALGAVHAA